jgi:hypothetical protein
MTRSGVSFNQRERELMKTTDAFIVTTTPKSGCRLLDKYTAIVNKLLPHYLRIYEHNLCDYSVIQKPHHIQILAYILFIASHPDLRAQVNVKTDTGSKLYSSLFEDMEDDTMKKNDPAYQPDKERIHRSRKYMSKINVCHNEHNHQLRRNRQIIAIRQHGRWLSNRDRHSIYPFVKTTDWGEQLLPNRWKTPDDKKYYKWVSDHVPCYQTLLLSQDTEMRSIVWNVLSKDLENDSFCYCNNSTTAKNGQSAIQEFVFPKDKDFFDKRIASICQRVRWWMTNSDRNTLITLVEADTRTARAVDDMLNALKRPTDSTLYKHHTEEFASGRKYGTYIILLSDKWTCTMDTSAVLPNRCDMFTIAQNATAVCNLCTVHLASGSEPINVRERTQQLRMIANAIPRHAPHTPLIIAGDRNCCIADFTRDLVGAACSVDTPHAFDQPFETDCGYPLTTFRIRGGETDQAMKMFEIFACQMMACASVVRADCGNGMGKGICWSQELQQPRPIYGLSEAYPYPVVPLGKDVLVSTVKFGRFAKRLQKYLQSAKLPNGKGRNIQEKLEILCGFGL